MAKTEEIKLKICRYLFYAILIIFPFGVLLKLRFVALNIQVNLFDIFILFSAFLTLILKFKLPKFTSHIISLFVLFSAGYFIFHDNLTLIEIIRGVLYLLRLVSYFLFFIFAWNLICKNVLKKKAIIESLILISLTVAIFGLAQYIFLPDLRSLKYIGWDDHLNRVVGTFLDPTYTALIIVFGILISIFEVIKRKLRYLPGLLILITSLFLTYSRASYLALLTSSMLLIKNKKIFYLFIVVFVYILFLLPRSGGYGVRLERTHSIFAKYSNYMETYKIFQKSPLFGVGYNNICSFRSRMFGESIYSHSCGGADSQILMILATSGVLGLIVLIYIIKIVHSKTIKTGNYMLLKSVTVAFIIHSSFSNSMFYSFVLAYYLILLSLVLRSDA